MFSEFLVLHFLKLIRIWQLGNVFSEIQSCLLEVANVFIFVCFRSMGIYQTRWSAKRLREIANAIKGKKRDVISKSSFGDLLHISPLVPPPEANLSMATKYSISIVSL